MNPIKVFAKRWTPPIALDLLGYAKAMYTLGRTWRLLKRNQELRDRYLGESVYILGNGPSLNNFDLESIRGHRVITMNHFELHPLKDQFDIVAHCVGEPYASSTWEDPSPMINGVAAKTYWFNVDAEPAFRDSSGRDVRFYLPGVRAAATFFDGDDVSGIALQYQSTAQMAITVALYLGFNNIHLVGFDHDWLVTRGHSPHFYAERDGVERADFSAIPYVDMIRTSLSLFEVYLKLARTSRKRNAKIFNLSEPSYLDVFPKLPSERPGEKC